MIGADTDPARYHRGDADTLARIVDVDVRRFLDYWLSLRRGRRMPARGDIDPLDIPWALTRLFLGDYDRADGSFTYRLAGEEIAAIFQRYNGKTCLRGVRLGEGMPAETARLLMERWQPVGERGDLLYMSGLVYLAAERIPVGERLILPLSDDGETVTGFLGFTKCQWVAAGERPDPPGLDISYVPLGAVPASL